MIFRSQYGDGKIMVCNVVVPQYNKMSKKYEMWVSYDGREDTYCKIAEYDKAEVIGFLIFEAINMKNIIFDLEENSDFKTKMKYGVQDLTEYIKVKFI